MIRSSCLIIVLLLHSISSAAFIVEAHETGLANDNFEFGGDTLFASESIPSTAVGLTAEHSIFGGDGLNEPDLYIFEYNPARGEDNVNFTAGTALGSTDGSPGNEYVATGKSGGVSGIYNVYITSPATTNVSGGLSLITLTQAGDDIELDIDLNNEGTGPNSQVNNGRGFVGGLNNAWYLLGSVEYQANQTYTVTLEAGSNTFVSQRVHGILWEYAPRSELAGDFDANGILDAADINELTTAVQGRRSDTIYDVNSDGDVDNQDRIFWVDELRRTYFGDANLDGEFNSTDFVIVFQAGEYEDALAANSKWETGDWNGDGEFDSSDFVTAFQSGGFEAGPQTEAMAVPEPTSGTMAIMLSIVIGPFLRFRRII